VTDLHESSVELASRLNSTAIIARVDEVRRLSDGVSEVSLEVGDAERIAGAPGNDVMVRLGDHDDHQIRRRYSVRSVDRTRGTIAMWIGTAHDGIGARWARGATRGAAVDVIGPRGKIELDSSATWHLFVGDTTALGAFARMIESVGPDASATLVVELDRLSDAHLPSPGGALRPSVVLAERRGRSPGDPRPLLDALNLVRLPEGPGHAYLFGELAAMHAVRAALRDRDLGDDAIDLKAFWRAGVGNQDHGEPPKD
jgi:NADPH-dependent ferric siderophore reductase